MTYTPVSGIFGNAIFTPTSPSSGSPLTLPVDDYEYDSGMKIHEAPAFVAAPYMQHTSGLARGLVRLTGTWDATFNYHALKMNLGDRGSIQLNINSSVISGSTDSEVAHWHVGDNVDGTVTYELLLVLNGIYSNFNGQPAVDPNIVL